MGPVNSNTGLPLPPHSLRVGFTLLSFLLSIHSQAGLVIRITWGALRETNTPELGDSDSFSRSMVTIYDEYHIILLHLISHYVM